MVGLLLQPVGCHFRRLVVEVVVVAAVDRRGGCSVVGSRVGRGRSRFGDCK